jgi:hypothetical protein
VYTTEIVDRKTPEDGMMRKMVGARPDTGEGKLLQTQTPNTQNASVRQKQNNAERISAG